MCLHGNSSCGHVEACLYTCALYTVFYVKCLQITEDQIQNAPEISFSPNHKMLMFSKSSYPPNVSFTVSQNRENDQPAGQLNCWIEAQGTHTVSGETLTFPLTSTKPINKGEWYIEKKFDFGFYYSIINF